MTLVRKVARQALFVIVPLAALSLLVDWNSKTLGFLRPFGNPAFTTVSILVGAGLGIANLKGMTWGIESLLGAHQANTKLVFLSLLRLLVLFAVVISLAALHLINLLGFLTGITVVFILTIKEALKTAKLQEKE
ncbi:MAG: hypothetical protein M1497_04795 [Nitrospirae bacterium]|nr:hypothetical protein [Nitrospirota bacterium]